MTRIPDDLARITHSSAQLNALADQAAQQIRDLNTLLDQLNPRVTTDQFQFAVGRERDHQDKRIQARYRLLYGRDDNRRFALIVDAWIPRVDDYGRPVSVDPSGDPNQWETVWVRRLDKVRSSLRMQALSRLPDVLADLANKAEASVTAASKGLSEAAAVAQELKAALANPVGALRP
jgi:hypothetical protein